MFETLITVVGRLVSDVTTRVTMSGDKVANFRIACQERRYDKALDSWVDGDRMYLGVSCWRRLADGVSASLAKGDQVVVHGRFRIREYVPEEGGGRRSSPELDAWSVGPNLAWHAVLVDRSASPVPAESTPVREQPVAA